MKDGLKALNLTAGHTKPTTQPGLVREVLTQSSNLPSILIEPPSDNKGEPEEDNPDLDFQDEDQSNLQCTDSPLKDKENDQLNPPSLLVARDKDTDDILPVAVSKVRALDLQCWIYVHFCLFDTDPNTVDSLS